MTMEVLERIIATEFFLFLDDNENPEASFVQVSKFELSKEDWMTYIFTKE